MDTSQSRSLETTMFSPIPTFPMSQLTSRRAMRALEIALARNDDEQDLDPVVEPSIEEKYPVRQPSFWEYQNVSINGVPLSEHMQNYIHRRR